MVNLIASLLGAGLAVLYVGFFAVSVGKPALLVIVVICLGLMFLAIYQDLREKRTSR